MTQPRTYLTQHDLTLNQAHAAIKRSRPASIKIWIGMQGYCAPVPKSSREDTFAYLSIDYDLEVIKTTFFTEIRPLSEIDQMLRDAKRLTMAEEKDSTRILSPLSTSSPYTGGEEE